MTWGGFVTCPCSTSHAAGHALEPSISWHFHRTLLTVPGGPDSVAAIMFQPAFQITPAIAKALMEVEASRQAVARLPLTVAMLNSLRKTARLLSTHYSTQIEGNRLSPSQVEQVLAGGGKFPGRERDEIEVRNYYRAVEFVESLVDDSKPLTDRLIRTIHGLVMSGKKKPTAYRDGQNVIRDSGSGSGRIIYLPPEAHDVPPLMAELVAWIARQIKANELPMPLIAGLAHYQFATIHPYYDGNGRTARLLTTLILHRGGYGLRGIYSLEEYYAQNLPGYYDALSVGKSHNYYMGRATADVTKFLAYFCHGLADSFSKVRSQAERAGRKKAFDQAPQLRSLTPQQRTALSLFVKTKTVTSSDVAAFFQITSRSAAALCKRWLAEKFFVIANPSKKARRYQLADEYDSLIENVK